MIETLGGRKFIFGLFSVLLAFVLVLAGSVTPEVWLDFVKLVMATYVAGNVVSKFSAK